MHRKPRALTGWVYGRLMGEPMFYRLLRALCVTGVLASGGGAVPLTAAAAQAAPVTDAVVRAAHFSPTTPRVDVYVARSSRSAKEWLSGVGYGAVSPYVRLAPGVYTVAMRLHGAARASKPVLTWSLDAKPGQAYTVAGIGSGASVRGVIIRDDLSAPPTGTGRVRVIEAASRVPTATVTARSGPVIARDVAFATTSAYATVPAGRWTIQASGGNPELTASTSIEVTAGTSTSVLLLDARGSGITVRTVVDSAGPGRVPNGPVYAGGGGTAVPYLVSTGPSALDTSVSAVAGLALVGGAWRLRRRTGRRVGAHAA